MDSDIGVRVARGVYHNPGMEIRVGHWCGRVGMSLGESRVWFRTPDAHATGLSLCRKATTLTPGEFVVLRVNGHDVPLAAGDAVRIGGALLRKADAADDWQRINH